MPETAYTCRGPKVEGAGAVTRDDDGRLLEPERVPCGLDITELIDTVPWDGEVHTVTCPNCGTETSVRRAAAQ
jgi:hypothetical protein